MVFGLGGLLVTIGVIVWIMGKAELPYDQAVLSADKQATSEVQQMAGRGEGGVPIANTFKLFPDLRSDGRLQDFQVSQLSPDSPLATDFGLQVNDVIVGAIDGHGVETDMQGSTDEKASQDAIIDAYSTGGKLIVQRGDQKLTLSGKPFNAFR